MTSKKELLKKVAKLEIQHLRKLTTAEKYVYIETWFMEQDSDHEDSTLEEILNHYLHDFMSWQEDKSIEELQEVINNYKHV